MIFDSVKKGILEVLEERLSSYCSEMMTIAGARSLTFRELRACGAPDYHGEKDPIGSKRWLTDVANAFRTSRCPKGGKVILESCLLKDKARDWCEKGCLAVCDDDVNGLT